MYITEIDQKIDTWSEGATLERDIALERDIDQERDIEIDQGTDQEREENQFEELY